MTLPLTEQPTDASASSPPRRSSNALTSPRPLPVYGMSSSTRTRRSVRCSTSAAKCDHAAADGESLRIVATRSTPRRGTTAGASGDLQALDVVRERVHGQRALRRGGVVRARDVEHALRRALELFDARRLAGDRVVDAFERAADARDRGRDGRKRLIGERRRVRAERDRRVGAARHAGRRAGLGRDVAEQGLHLGGRGARRLGELAHLVRDDAEAAAVHAGASRFDRGVEREQVRAVRDVFDELHGSADLRARLEQLANGVGCRPAVACEPVDRAAEVGDLLRRERSRPTARRTRRRARRARSRSSRRARARHLGSSRRHRAAKLLAGARSRRWHPSSHAHGRSRRPCGRRDAPILAGSRVLNRQGDRRSRDPNV